MWLGLSHRQAKHNEKTLEFMGSLTPCEDAQKGSENKAFIQVFHPIQSVKQSVKSNNKAMIHSHLTTQGASTLASLSMEYP